MKRIYMVCIFAAASFFLLVSACHPPTVTTALYPQECRLIVLMYHGFTKGGKESDFVLDVSKFDEDIQLLKKEGFYFADTNDIALFNEGRKSLPEKCVMITIDDGYTNNYTYAFEIIEKHNIKVVISPIAYYSEYYTLHPDKNPAYSHLSKDEIVEMHSSGLVDFQNHSYNMHSLGQRRGSAKIDSETPDEYIREFYYDLKRAELVFKEYIGKKPHAYVYPFGSISEESKSILKCCGYKIGISCNGGINRITPGKSDFLMLRRYNRTPSVSASQILSHY